MSLHGRRRSHYHKRLVEDSVHCLSIASKRTSSDFYGKRTNVSFDKAENTETVHVRFTYFSLTPACLLRCRRSSLPAIGRLDGTQITLTLSSLLQTLAYHLQTHDRRFSADGSVLFSICIRSRSSLSAADSTVLS